MAALTRLREELDELEVELEDASSVPDAVPQPEVVQARTAVEEARKAVASAFLSRRAMVVAREALARAHGAVAAALQVSQTLRDRSAALRANAGEIRSLAESARSQGGTMAEWSRQLRADLADQARAQVLVDSAIPPEHPHAAAIEAAVKETLALAGGCWKVWITVSPGGAWWGVRVRGPAIDWVGILQDAAEQSPEGMARRLEPLVRVAIAESVYRRVQREGRGRRGPVGEGPAS